MLKVTGIGFRYDSKLRPVSKWRKGFLMQKQGIPSVEVTFKLYTDVPQGTLHGIIREMLNELERKYDKK